MKNLTLGILLILILGIGGFVYRNAVEHPTQPITCPLDALRCPDGTAVSRTGSSCTFSACSLPNVSLSDINISFAVPEGFTATEFPDSASVAAYEKSTASSTSVASIIIRRYAIEAPTDSTDSNNSLQASSPQTTALYTIQQTALGSPSGLPLPSTAFSSTILGTRRFTVVSIERFEGVVDTAYYLARGTDVLRFDAIDRGVTNWTDSHQDISTLPAHAALGKLLTTLQGG